MCGGGGCCCWLLLLFFFFFQAEDGIRDHCVTGVQTCALPIYRSRHKCCHLFPFSAYCYQNMELCTTGFTQGPGEIGRASCRERV